MPSEESYVQYLSKHENIDCKELQIEGTLILMSLTTRSYSAARRRRLITKQNRQFSAEGQVRST